MPEGDRVLIGGPRCVSSGTGVRVWGYSLEQLRQLKSGRIGVDMFKMRGIFKYLNMTYIT